MRWVIYTTADGIVQRYGDVDEADDLGPVDPATETAVQDETLFSPNRVYAWTGAAFEDVGAATSVQFHASCSRVDAEDVPITADWSPVQRTFTTPAFFSRGAVFANAVGMLQAVGGTVLIRVMEDPGHEVGELLVYDGTDDRCLTDNEGQGYHEYPETGASAFVAVDIHSDQPLTLKDQKSEYRLEVKLGTATSGTIRAPSLALLEPRDRKK